MPRIQNCVKPKPCKKMNQCEDLSEVNFFWKEDFGDNKHGKGLRGKKDEEGR
jgi:hypothetical protein